jgi:hypothetical protein
MEHDAPTAAMTTCDLRAADLRKQEGNQAMTDTAAPQSPNAPQGMDADAVFVRQVPAFVEATAEEFNKAYGKGLFYWERHLFRTLEVNCAAKAKLAEMFIAQEAKFEGRKIGREEKNRARRHPRKSRGD